VKVGYHDIPRSEHLSGGAWQNMGKRGLVVQANLATDSGGDRPTVDLIREHRKNGGVFIQRLDLTWDDTLPKPDQAAKNWAIQCELFLRELQGEVDFVQLGNEPDLAHKQRGELTPEQHAQTFAIVARHLSGYKCTYAPLGWLAWAARLHPADYMKRFYNELLISGNDDLVKWIPFHAYDQVMGWDTSVKMRDLPGVFYSRRTIENQLEVLPEWAKGLPRYWVECNAIAHPDSGEWRNDHAQFVREVCEYAATQGMSGIAFFRLWRGYPAYLKDYGYAHLPEAMRAIAEAQARHDGGPVGPVPPITNTATINEMYRVVSDLPFLRVRSSPERADGNVIGCVRKGEQLRVLNIRGGWAEVALGAGGAALHKDEGLSTMATGFVLASLIREAI